MPSWLTWRKALFLGTGILMSLGVLLLPTGGPLQLFVAWFFAACVVWAADAVAPFASFLLDRMPNTAGTPASSTYNREPGGALVPKPAACAFCGGNASRCCALCGRWYCSSCAPDLFASLMNGSMDFDTYEELKKSSVPCCPGCWGR